MFSVTISHVYLEIETRYFFFIMSSLTLLAAVREDAIFMKTFQAIIHVHGLIIARNVVSIRLFRLGYLQAMISPRFAVHGEIIARNGFQETFCFSVDDENFTEPHHHRLYCSLISAP